MTFFWFFMSAIFNQSETDNDLEDEASLVSPLLFGFDFNFSEKVGMELSYENGLTEPTQDVNVHSPLTSLLYHFK